MKVERVESHDAVFTLVDRMKNGDREAFMAVIRLYQKKVFLLAYSYFRNSEDAMDIVQETFLRLYQKAGMFQKGRNFQNWLLQIAKNLCIDFYRKNYKRSNGLQREKSLEDLNSPVGESDNCQTSSDIHHIFSECLKGLTEKQRMIFTMKHYNNLEYREIAQILKISVGTVKSLHFKAVQNLRTLMTPYLEGQS
ncbi:MAG: RNA polymerase sigma factor [Candidatus Aminicenantes bacterium]|nr:RNA polymerase sigma factor [Candidatus Aminicenantes bacterium]